MTKLRQLWLLTALASVMALVGGYFLLVSPKASKAEALREETATQEQLNESLRSQIQMLNRQKKDLPRQQAELERFAKKIPNNPALPALVRSLSDAADNAGLDLVAIAPGQPTAVVAGGAAAPATAAGTPTTAGAAATRIPIAAIPIAVKFSGTYSEISQFFSEVERLPRAFLVTTFTLSEAPKQPPGSAPNATLPKGPLIVSMTGQLYMTIKAPAAAAQPQPAATTVVN